jgi:hypothetical protein
MYSRQSWEGDLAIIRKTSLLSMLLGCALMVAPALGNTRVLAPSPPMGWNSWDSYGFTIDEADYRANAQVLASIKQHGWSYAVVDMGWYMGKPSGDKREARDFQIDANGLLLPAPNRFPSATDGAGFKPLADWVHSLGLKFGFHIMRGIPRGAVERNTPIAGSAFRAADAADTTDVCGWDDSNYGIRDNAAGQAYYDSMMRLYAQWGADFIKVDCIADHPYKPTEIRQIAAAIEKSGRPIVLSLSPGATQLEHAAEVARYSQMWRISNDIWDKWHFHDDPGEYPAGVDTAFDTLAKWSRFVKRGTWPDADMLPLGSLRPHPGMGEPRDSGLTQDEQRTQFTLWAIARSPLMLGTNLTQLDPFTRSLVTNDKVIGVNQTARESHALSDLPPGFENVRVWTATAGTKSRPVRYIAFFNLADQPAQLSATWQQLGIAGAHSAIELWSGETLPSARAIAVTLPKHGSAIYEIR